MLRRIRRAVPSLAALAAVGGLVALAGASGVFAGITIVAPASVVGGNPINGYVTCHIPPVNVYGTASGGTNLPGSPAYGSSDPAFFSFGTRESMSGTVVAITASDSKGGTATAAVVVQ